MSVITALLDKLADERALLAEVEGQIDNAIPADLKTIKVEVEGRVKCLESEIKDKAKYVPDSQAHTLVGRLLQLVWTNGRKDTAKLEALAIRLGATSEDLSTCKGESFWSIKARGRG